MSLHFAEGDLLSDSMLAQFDAIGHGVNCVGAMGAGIAYQIADKWPALEKEYRRACLSKRGLRPGEVIVWRPSKKLYVYNIATQYLPGADARYEFLVAGMLNTLASMRLKRLSSLGLPRIGTGIGGLDQQVVESIIFGLSLVWDRVDITIVDYKPKESSEDHD